ncbi:DUF2442 domain-containing protein [Jiella sp. M17.18]|uniref:DUF2442 domain-containing protein n=1 Tax=Jiella sp. M17.18 TaxID=3234247 RepID=UPI0034DEEED6
MPDDAVVTVGGPLPRIADVEPLDRFRVRLTWGDGRVEERDLAPPVWNHRHFVPLRTDPDLFRQVSVADWGSALAWPGGLELSAEWIDRLPRPMSNEEFRRAMDDLSMTLDGMAATLGIARRQVAAYRKDKPLPNYIALAVRALTSARAAHA